MAKLRVPLRPYFERVDSQYGDDLPGWEEALAVIATELARRPGGPDAAPEQAEIERGAAPCRPDGSSSDTPSL